jgi:site-specific recombinase XerD
LLHTQGVTGSNPVPPTKAALGAGYKELELQKEAKKAKRAGGCSYDPLPSEKRKSKRNPTKPPQGNSNDNILDQYLRFCELKGLAPATLNIYRPKIRAFLATLPDNKPPSQEDVLAFVGTLRDRKTMPGGISIHLRSLKSFLRWAKAKGYYRENPMEGLPSMAHVRPVIVQTLSMDNIQKLINAARKLIRNRERDLCILYLMLDCAIRPGELRSIRVQDVNLDYGAVKVAGKMGERVVPFTGPTKQAIQTWLKKRPQIAGQDALLLSCKGEPLTQSALRSVFRYLAKAAKLDGRLYPYLLRHTSATELLRGGASLEVVRLMLGHQNYSITQRYLTLDTGDLAKAQHRASVVGRMK